MPKNDITGEWLHRRLSGLDFTRWSAARWHSGQSPQEQTVVDGDQIVRDKDSWTILQILYKPGTKLQSCRQIRRFSFFLCIVEIKLAIKRNKRRDVGFGSNPNGGIGEQVNHHHYKFEQHWWKENIYDIITCVYVCALNRWAPQMSLQFHTVDSISDWDDRTFRNWNDNEWSIHHRSSQRIRRRPYSKLR